MLCNLFETMYLVLKQNLKLLDLPFSGWGVGNLSPKHIGLFRKANMIQDMKNLPYGVLIK